MFKESDYFTSIKNEDDLLSKEEKETVQAKLTQAMRAKQETYLREMPGLLQNMMSKQDQKDPKKKQDIEKMKLSINLMTDKRTVAYIRKEHHEKYGAEITGYLMRTNQSDRGNNQNEQIPESASEPEKNNENISK